MIVVLTGGTGGAKFVDGLRQALPPRDLTLIVNTGDDLEWWGLAVSPDLDSITYVLAGLLSRERGWGVQDDTFLCLQMMARLGRPAWFQIGDRDLATHLLRSQLLQSGQDPDRSHRRNRRPLRHRSQDFAHERCPGPNPSRNPGR